MPNYLRNEVVLVRYPFSDLTDFKVRPAVIVNGLHSSRDLFIVALTSRTTNLLSGEFVLSAWKTSGLNVETAVKRGIFTIHEKLIIKSLGKLSDQDSEDLDTSLRNWFKLN
jgi:mRNA interferase MazF